MYNWSTDEKSLAKKGQKQAIWRLEQLINFGLDGAKLKKTEVQKYWTQLKIDPARKAYLKFLLK